MRCSTYFKKRHKKKMVALSRTDECSEYCVSQLNAEEFEEGKERGYLSYFYFLNTDRKLTICIAPQNAEALRERALVSAAGYMAIGVLKMPWNTERQTFALAENFTVVKNKWIQVDDLSSEIAAMEFTSCGQAKISFGSSSTNFFASWTEFMESDEPTRSTNDPLCKHIASCTS